MNSNLQRRQKHRSMRIIEESDYVSHERGNCRPPNPCLQGSCFVLPQFRHRTAIVVAFARVLDAAMIIPGTQTSLETYSACERNHYVVELKYRNVKSKWSESSKRYIRIKYKSGMIFICKKKKKKSRCTFR